MILNVCPNPSIDSYAWLRKIEPGGVNRIEKLQEFPGGKGVHVALAVSELGTISRVFGCWGGGTGSWIKKACSEKGIQVSGVTLEGNSRKCYTFLSEQADFSNTEIIEPGPPMTFQNWLVFKQLFKEEIEKANFICLSGSWPSKAPKDAYLQLIQEAEKQGKKLILDCSGEQLEEAIKSSFFGLHLNEHEAFKLCGSKDPEILLDKLEKKIELVALTRGEEGLWMWYEGKAHIANVKIEEVVSTVGSGDCLTAGIAWAVQKGLSPEEVAAFGVACGAANCLNEDLGMLKKKDVVELLPRVTVKTEKHER